MARDEAEYLRSTAQKKPVPVAAKVQPKPLVIGPTNIAARGKASVPRGRAPVSGPAVIPPTENPFANAWQSIKEGATAAAQQAAEAFASTNRTWQTPGRSETGLPTRHNPVPAQPPSYTPQPTGTFAGAGGANIRTGEATGTFQGTRFVRTGENTYQEIPWQPGMLTGTFFSGGRLPLAQQQADRGGGRGTMLPNRKQGKSIWAPPTMAAAPVPFVPVQDLGAGYDYYGSGGGRGGGGRGGGGRGGGGYSYQPNASRPLWLQNLYNWGFKG